jgi:hypothetical protein
MWYREKRPLTNTLALARAVAVREGEILEGWYDEDLLMGGHPWVEICLVLAVCTYPRMNQTRSEWCQSMPPLDQIGSPPCNKYRA